MLRKFQLFIFACLPVLVLGQHNMLLIPNKGQYHPEVLYKTSIPGGNFYINKEGLTFDFADFEAIHKMHDGEKVDTLKAHAVKMNFIGANEFSQSKLDLIAKHKYNFYQSKNPKHWASNVSAGKSVTCYDIYPGIDFEVNTENGNLKYNYIVSPASNPSAIQIQIEGASSIEVIRGKLHINTRLGTFIDDAPKAWTSDGEQVEVRYELKDNILSYWVGEYDSTKSMIIDPSIIFSTYSGSNSINFGFTATYDEKGFLYAGGSVFGGGYPTTAGAYDITFNSYQPTECGFFQCWGVSDIAITKYDTTGTNLIYSTYIGGELSELPHSLIVNQADELYIYGTTGSEDYPITPNAYDTTFNGGTGANLAAGIYVNYRTGVDIIVTKLSADGGTLEASTYLGGSANDGFNLANPLTYNYADQIRGEIILSPEGYPIIASSTYSGDFPITPGALQNTSQGNQEGVITSFNYDLSQIRWSTYFGGAEHEAIYSVDIGLDSSIYIAGGTNSNNLQTTTNAYEGSYLGNVDGFMSVINKDGTSLEYCSYFGTSAYDQIYFIRNGLDSNVYIFGQTEHFGNDLIFNASYSIPNSGQFLTKFEPNIENRVWSTVFGSGDGVVNISPTAFKVDLCNRVYLTGWGSNSSGFDGINDNQSVGPAGMEVTPDAFQSTTTGGDYYFMVLEDDASDLTYATFFGGDLSDEHVDGGTSRFDRKGVLYQSMCAGCANNSDMPIVPTNAWSPTNNSTCNNGVLKFDFDIPSLVADFIVPETACSDTAYRFINTSREQGETSYLWRFGDGDTSTEYSPTHQYAQSGSYLVTLIASDPSSCNQADSISKTVTIFDPPSSLEVNIDVLGDTTECNLNALDLGHSPDLYGNYRWLNQTGATLSNTSEPYSWPLDTGDNFVQVLYTDSFGCSVRDTLSFRNKYLLAEVTDSLVLCADAEPRLESTTSSSSPIHYRWEPISIITSDTTLPYADINPMVGTNYVQLFVRNDENCFDTLETVIYLPSIALDSIDISISPTRIALGESARLDVNSTTSSNINWSPFEPQLVLGNQYEVSPEESTIFEASISDTSGQCTKSDTASIEVIEILCGPPYVYVPNAFTPNNDGANDVLYVRGREIIEMYFAIFNRWGEKVFESTQLDDGWDGIFKGERCDPAVYDYYLEYSCDGVNEQFMKGNITLIR